jgi:hypothetical protein
MNEFALPVKIQQEIRSPNADMTIVNIPVMTESLEGATAFFTFRLGASLAGFFGILGLILATVGTLLVSFIHHRLTIARDVSSRRPGSNFRGGNSVMLVNLGMGTVFLGVMVGLLG